MEDDDEESLLSENVRYGSVATTTTIDDDEDDNNDDASERNFRLGKTKWKHSNVLTSMRFINTESNSSFMMDDEYDNKVPSLMTDNVTMVLDSNLGRHDKGRLYYAESAFYRSNHEPQYALTVNDDIYFRMIKEVSDARRVPCGLYFCCHQGDGGGGGGGRHLDIQLAWTCLGLMVVGMLILSVFDV